MTVETFGEEALGWLQQAEHPQLGRPYLSCGFVPMVELLRYLEANGFTTYIASGGDRDFMRPFAEQLYGVPPERVIGSALGLDFTAADDGTDLLYKSKIEFFDDGPEKPVRIWSRIGRRPLVAGGNSNGDVPMLRFAETPERPALRLLVLHDDGDREFDYVAGAEDALERAKVGDMDGRSASRTTGPECSPIHDDRHLAGAARRHRPQGQPPTRRCRPDARRRRPPASTSWRSRRGRSAISTASTATSWRRRRSTPATGSG